MLCLKGVYCAVLGRVVVAGLTVLIPATSVSVQGISAQTLPTPVNLSSAVGGGSNPVMVTDANGGINAAWFGSGVFFARSTDGGATFSTATVVPLSAPPLGVQLGLDASGNIELLWPTSPDDTHPGGRAFLSRSTDGGMTFSAAVEFTPPGGVTSSAIQLVVETGGAVDVVWQDQPRANLFFARSTDGGANFSTPLMVWSELQDLSDLHVARGANNQIYAFWTHITNSVQCDVLASRSVDGGTTFSPVTNVSAMSGNCSASPKPFVDLKGGVNVAWLVNNQSVWFARSSDQGGSFSAPSTVTGNVAFFLASDQQISADFRGELDVVWTGELAQNTVFFAHSNDAGTTWSAPKIVSLPPQANATGAGNPAITEDLCGEILVGWSDDSAGTFSGDFDIYLGRSGDDGRRFTNPLNISNTAADAEVISQIAVDSQGMASVLWSTISFPSNVFFSRFPAVLARPGDFDTVVAPQDVTVAQGASQQFLVAPVPLPLLGAGETVNLSCSDLPPGSTCTFTPATVMTQVLPPQTSTLTLTIPAGLTPGAYPFGVNGVSATTTSTQTVEVTVAAPGGGMARPARMAGMGTLAARGEETAFATRGANESTTPRLLAPMDGSVPPACTSGNERLCGALFPGRPSPRRPIARRCRGNRELPVPSGL
jgi:hypothetical protein